MMNQSLHQQLWSCTWKTWEPREVTEIMEAYNQIVVKYEEKGYIRRVKQSEASEQWLLPHFPVLRPDKTTT